ncbi:MAG: tRNA-guanine transglycosylase [Nitrososphaeria archaeon]
MNFKLNLFTNDGRIGRLKIDEKEIETPTIFFQYPFRNYQFFWKDIPINALLINAHYLLRKKLLLRNIHKVGIKKFLDFNGIIMIDSGGHQIQKYGYAIEAKQIAHVYNMLQPDIGVVLDKPIHPGLPKSSVRNAVDYMIQNYYEMKSNTHVTLLPVIHGYSKEIIDRCVKKIESQFWGVGSLVPLILGKTSNVIGSNKIMGVKNGKKMLIDTICLIRKIVGEKVFLHVFGIGSALTMHIMFYLGVDSVDSASYEWFARYGHIQLPGKGRINVSGLAREKCSGQKINWKKYTCDCPVCSSVEKSKLHNILKTCKNARVIHNLYVHSKEVEIARQKIKENDYEPFIEKRLKGTQFYKLFKYAQHVKNSLRI